MGELRQMTERADIESLMEYIIYGEIDGETNLM